MAFCTKCGAAVEGSFCTKCGAQVGVSDGPGVQPGQPAPAGTPINLPPPAAPAPRKLGPLIWILGGCLALVIIAGVIAVSTGLFVAHKAGLKDVRDGKIVFQDDQNKQVEIQTQGEGENASVEIKSSEGTVRMGAAASVQLPAWLPSYPGAEAAGTFSFSADKGQAGSCAFKTGDSAEDVASFYEEALKNAGFEVQKTTTQIPGQGSIIILGGQDKNGKRNAQVTAASAGEGTTINLVFETGK